MKAPVIVVAGFVGVALVRDGVSAQSLADLARKEAERRKAVAAPAKVYSDEDVRPFAEIESAAAGRRAGTGTAVAAAEPPSEPGVPAAATAGKVSPPSAEAVAAAPPDSTDEAYWKGAVGEARLALDRDRGFLEALQTRAGVLAAQFAAQGDQSQRAAIVTNLTGVRTEIDRLLKEIGQKTQELASLEEQARRAGVPPGWIRLPQP
jgi:hypothetical protein